MNIKPYLLLFLSSILFFSIIEITDTDIPIPNGVYRGERYRLSEIEPDAEVKTQVKVSRNGEIQQTLVLNDLSLKSHAAFTFTGKIYGCSLYYCSYQSTAHALEKPEITQSLFKSRYLDLLNSDNKINSSKVHILYKDGSILFVSVEDHDDIRYNLYTFEPR